MKIVQMLDRSLTKDQKERYMIVCQYTWGCAPFEVDWAIDTNLYKATEAKLVSSGIIAEGPSIEPVDQKG